MSDAWKTLADEIACWADEGRTVEFWWRDDDANQDHPALHRLVGLSKTSGIALGLAVVPQGADPAMLVGLPSGIAILQHGCDHANRAPAGERKCEFPESVPAELRLAQLVQARATLIEASAGRALPVLVPPWNRLDNAFAMRLPAAGFTGLSRFKARANPRSKSQAVAGLVEVNTHADIMDWRGSRGFAGDDAVLAPLVDHLKAKRAGQADAAEPTGLLTHHLVHDAAAWDFLERLFDFTGSLAAVRWRHPVDLFTAA